MAREQGPFKTDNPWPRIGWWSVAGLLAAGAVLGFVVLGGEQQNGPRLGTWTAICRALGIASDTGPATAPQPPLQTPTRIAWTAATLARIAGGDVKHGEFVALNCAACHGEQGVSQSGLFPTLAGMDAGIIYKQLDDFRAGKRSWGAMNAIATALSDQDAADVAAYFAGRVNGLAPILGENFHGGRTLREADVATRLAFAGDPARGIPPCAACHGPSASKPGAPSLKGQRPEYIERQLAAFAQGIRQNDINRQMRTVAMQLTPDEMHAIAVYYGSGAAPAELAGR
ncbi:MAG: c-type cytochrome [Methylobacteriaceae bacterium]|nr:c-type cytochrome [Methylobacteriaceae bacterium]